MLKRLLLMLTFVAAVAAGCGSGTTETPTDGLDNSLETPTLDGGMETPVS